MEDNGHSGKVCENCQKPIPNRKRSQARFCSVKCRDKKYLMQDNPPVAKSFIGAMGELIVCSDLLSKGYHVFRNVSQHGPCDIVIIKDNKCFRVEVKTGRILPSGLMVHSPVTERNSYDILAVALNGKAVYLNELP